MKNYIENLKLYKEKILLFFRKQNVQNIIFILVCIFCLILGMYGFKRPSAMLIFYIMMQRIHTFDFILNMVKKRQKDKEALNQHWLLDADLIILTKFCRVLLLIVVLLVMQSIYIMGNPSNILDVGVLQIKAFKYLKYAFFIYVFVLCLYFFADCHVIIFRNFPIINKFMSIGESSLKYVGMIGMGTLFYTDVTSRTFFLEPNDMGNLYQKNFGRGFGFISAIDHQRHEVMKTIDPKYDAKSLIDPTTGLLDSKKLQEYINMNKSELQKTQSVVTCQLLGINQGRFF